jgi:hypothetical protein
MCILIGLSYIPVLYKNYNNLNMPHEILILDSYYDGRDTNQLPSEHRP